MLCKLSSHAHDEGNFTYHKLEISNGLKYDPEPSVSLSLEMAQADIFPCVSFPCKKKCPLPQDYKTSLHMYKLYTLEPHHQAIPKVSQRMFPDVIYTL